MIISYHGLEFVRVQFGDTVIALNPPSKDSPVKVNRSGATICLSTLNHRDMAGVETVTFGGTKPFVISGPGEYEIGGVLVRGFPARSRYGGEDRINTVYLVTLEGITLCFLGAIASPELPPEAKEALDSIDVLFVPIGGDGVLTPEAAYKLAVALEAGIVIPIHFGAVGGGKALQTFLKESGAEKTEPVEKLTLRKKDLEGKEGEVVVLKQA
jgi:L-ascorbate metabolism protein UlaG (beta-lactamase superfamily)